MLTEKNATNPRFAFRLIATPPENDGRLRGDDVCGESDRSSEPRHRNSPEDWPSLDFKTLKNPRGVDASKAGGGRCKPCQRDFWTQNRYVSPQLRKWRDPKSEKPRDLRPIGGGEFRTSPGSFVSVSLANRWIAHLVTLDFF